MLKKSVTGFEEAAKKLLYFYHWSGNVRELKQIIQSAVLLTGEGLITVEALGLKDADIDNISEFALIDDRIQKERIQKALKLAGGNKRQAARLLGITPPTLYKKIEQYHIKL